MFLFIILNLFRVIKTRYQYNKQFIFTKTAANFNKIKSFYERDGWGIFL